MKLPLSLPALFLLLIPLCNCMGAQDVIGFSKRAFSGQEGTEISVCVELIIIDNGGSHEVTIAFNFGNYGKIFHTIGKKIVTSSEVRNSVGMLSVQNASYRVL